MHPTSRTGQPPPLNPPQPRAGLRHSPPASTHETPHSTPPGAPPPRRLHLAGPIAHAARRPNPSLPGPARKPGLRRRRHISAADPRTLQPYASGAAAVVVVAPAAPAPSPAAAGAPESDGVELGLGPVSQEPPGRGSARRTAEGVPRGRRPRRDAPAPRADARRGAGVQVDVHSAGPGTPGRSREGNETADLGRPGPASPESAPSARTGTGPADWGGPWTPVPKGGRGAGPGGRL